LEAFEMRGWQQIFRLLRLLNLAPAGNLFPSPSENLDKGNTAQMPDSKGLLWKIRNISRSKLICVGGAIILMAILVALLANFITTYPPEAQDLSHTLLAPGKGGHLLGTDEFGRDLLSRIVYGTRVSFRVAFVSISIAFSCGCFLGVVSGYFGAKLDMFLGRVIDVMMSFPPLLLALLVMAVLGASLTNATIAIGITYIPRFYRVVRASTLVVRERVFISAAKAVGRSDVGIIVRHVAPNVLAPVLVVTSLVVGAAILTEAELSFLGLGAQPPTPSWGVICSGGRTYLSIAPWISGLSGLAVMIVVLGCNLLGDGLRDMLDPKLRT
jgi:peptide/nickel transport system permease protein